MAIVSLKRAWLAGLLVTSLCAVAQAQESPSPEQLKQLYDDATSQLKAAQDRKNELSVENEKLTARITELEKSVTDLETTNRQLARQAADHFRDTWMLRSHYEAWSAFVSRYPRLKAEWAQFLNPDYTKFNPLSAPPTEPADGKIPQP